jgi:hypothetical protein
MEGGIDSSHVSWLHRDAADRSVDAGPRGNQQHGRCDAGVWVVDQPAGSFIGARRSQEGYYWRITPWCMPSFTMIALRGNHPAGHFDPIDDEPLGVELISSDAKLTAAEVAGVRTARHPHADHSGTYTGRQPQRRCLMDRAAAGSPYSGVAGIAMQDASLQESMGPVMDRSREHLLSTDNGIIMARQRLLRAARALEKGEPPPGIDPVTHHVRSAAVVLPRDAAFADAAREALTARPGVAPTSV